MTQCRAKNCTKERYLIGLCWDHWMTIQELLTTNVSVSTDNYRQFVIYTGLKIDPKTSLVAPR